MLPLVERELARVARRRAPYALRMIIPACSFALLCLLWYWMSLFSNVGVATPQGRVDPYGSESLGRTLSMAAFAFQMSVVMIMAPILSASTIAQEKQDRTLGLLLMADMRGFDIVVSKWLSTFLQVELLLLTTLPVLAIAALFGGVAVPVMALQVALLSVSAGTVCALGVLMSTVAKRTGEALVATLLLYAAYSMVIQLVAPLTQQSLGLNLFGAAYESETLYLLGAGFWIRPLIVALCLTALLLVTAARVLPLQALERSVGRRVHTGVVGVLTKPIRLSRRRKSPRDPLPYLVQRCSIGLASRIPSTLIKAILSLALAMFSIMVCGIGMMLIVALLAYDVTSSMQQFKKTGMLDDLRVTALDRREWALGIYRGHLRRCWLYFPGILLNGMYGLLFMAMFFDPPGGLEFGIPYTIAVVALVLLYAVLLYRMLVAAACFFSRSVASVGVQTLLVVITYIIIWIVPAFILGLVSGGLMIGSVTPFMRDWVALAIYTCVNLGVVAVLLLFFRQMHRETFMEESWFQN